MIKTNHVQKYNPGDTIIQQGEEGQSAYIIESGSIEILIEKENGLVQHIGTRSAGSIIGEMALVDNKPRTATIKAIEPCELLEITQSDFETRLESSDPIISMVMRVILARYRDMMTRSQIIGKPSNGTSPEAIEKNFVQSTNAIQDLKLIQDIKKALENDEFVLHYQPIFNVKTNTVAGFEALIRWHHPEKGLIYPDLFIELAEENGIITDISRWVTKKSCHFLASLQKQSPLLNDLFMSVNYSAKDFLVPDFKNYILQALEESDLSPSQFHIEITERLLMDQPNDAKDVLSDCQQAGLTTSIDDFGTGYSSLSYLHYFPINILKIDRSFIVSIERDESVRKLVSSIISLGHNLGMSIIAEGIEEASQTNTLKEMKCDKIQGYFYSKPLNENDVLKFLSSNT